jgi:DNA-binding LacI/PurR family transcriptional regulator
MRITLTDVAREAGVSVQTASHVLAGNLTVRLPEATRQRVKEAANKVGYRPNRLAQAMKRGKTQVIGIWMPLDRPVITYMRYLQLFSELAGRAGYDLMITGLTAEMAMTPERPLPVSFPVDGIISLDAGKAMETFRKDPQNDETPVVILGYEEVANGDSVAWDVSGAAREATQALIRAGAERIVHVTLDWILERFPREKRRTGYREAMEEAGLEPEYVGVQGETSARAEEAVLAYVQEKGVPDAIFGFTDPLAIGAARAVQGLGVQVPEACIVWGFGDFPEGEDFRVPLSTIRAPLAAIASQAFEWLLDRIEHPERESRQVVLPMELVRRASTR